MDQDQNTPTPAGTPTPSFPPAADQNNKPNALLIGGLLFIILIAILGWYLMQTPSTPTPEVMPIVETPAPAPAPTPAQNLNVDAAAAAFGAQSTSDEEGAIDQDLEATNLDSLNEIDQI
jgi:hypothetical protein